MIAKHTLRKRVVLLAVIFENDCCMCAVPGYPCTGEHKRVPHLYCDNCKEEAEVLYKTECQELCAECVLKIFEKVKVD